MEWYKIAIAPVEQEQPKIEYAKITDSDGNSRLIECWEEGGEICCQDVLARGIIGKGRSRNHAIGDLLNQLGGISRIV